MEIKPLKIVYADDDYGDIELFQEATSEISENIILYIARNGNELFQLLDSINLPDYIVLDLKMPGLDGKRCLELLRTHKRFSTIPIVVYTTVGCDQIVKECVHLGANYFVIKPSTFQEIVRIVSNLYQHTLESFEIK